MAYAQLKGEHRRRNALRLYNIQTDKRAIIYAD